MASNINTANIDVQYPQAGKDNDTSGFRNNFELIRDNLDTVKSEISNLQANTARTDETTDFNGSVIQDADLLGTTETAFELGNTFEDQIIDFRNGSYQTVSVTADVAVTLLGWPDSNRLAKITVAMLSDGTERTVTLALDGGGQLKKNTGVPVQLYDSTDGFNTTVGGFPDPLVVSSDSNPVVIEFWTIDGGDTVYANYLGQFV